MIQLQSDGSNAATIPRGFFLFEPKRFKDLAPGQYYSLCTLLDAKDPKIRPGPSGYVVYYSGVYGIRTGHVYALENQLITVECNGCVANVSELILHDVERGVEVTESARANVFKGVFSTFGCI